MEGVSSLKDIVPLPDTDAALNPDKKEVTHALDEKATDSHALAVANHDEKGHAQQQPKQRDREADVKDLGWNESKEKIPSPLVGGMANEDLWVLVRRFNKQMYHVKEYPHPVPGNLDLNLAEDEEFSPDKLRANFERLYMTVGIGLMGATKQIVRLRSWRETRRTAAFCAAYSIAWLFDFIVPLLTCTLLVLILWPPSRDILFPPAPIALVSTKTGGVQKPKAGVLGSTDSATGAPENHKGEAVEAEASNFVNSIASVALSSASGKHPQNDPSPAEAQDESGDAPNERVPDPTTMAVSASNARVSAGGGAGNAQVDKTKVPMETAMWNKMRPMMHGLADVADTWERFANALDTTPPFPRDVYRLRLATLVVPLFAASFFISNYMVMKGTTFGLGFTFFGDPLIMRGLDWLNTNFPKWQKLLDLRNTLLKGVPTNAQLTLTLLRIGEANKAPLPPPLPPPPRPPTNPPKSPTPTSAPPAPTGPSTPPTRNSKKPYPTTLPSRTKPRDPTSQPPKPATTAPRAPASCADHLKAKAGSEHAKHRLGVVPHSREENLSGPVDFKARFHGRKGHAYISTRATIPCLSFSVDKGIATSGSTGKSEEELHPVWSVAVADIKEVRKVGGLGWKAKLVVGWALDREVADGIEVVDRRGEKWVLTAMVLRDELFNRLVAMGGQKWEAW
ncbi:hypothetical protein KC326_g8604 [Hortaea werneckii]|nr:hypothetical protein KC326_g8604 [Hortaea werneckii]